MATMPTEPDVVDPAPTVVPDDPRALHLVSVLASGLPKELGTGTAPAVYTVPAVFSRQVTHEERLRIEDPATARLLVERTGADPALALVVEDRRLLIQHTTLTQLENGLSAAIGKMLASLGEQLHTEQEHREAEAGARQAAEEARFDLVSRQAARIRFDAPTTYGTGGDRSADPT
jgi:hypothetical protein